MPDTEHKEGEQKVPKKGGKLSKYKWWVIGGLAAVAILVFYFARKNAGSQQQATQVQPGVDPSTGLPYASEYGTGGMFGGVGSAGPIGPTGTRGPRGARGARGPRGKTRVVYRYRPRPQPRHHRRMHPATQLTTAHAANFSRAV